MKHKRKHTPLDIKPCPYFKDCDTCIAYHKKNEDRTPCDMIAHLAEIESAVAWRETWLAEYWPIGANRLHINVTDITGRLIAFGEGDTELQAMLDAYQTTVKETP